MSILPFLLLSLSLLGFSDASPTLALRQSTDSPQRQNQTIRWVDCHNKVPLPLISELNVTGTTFNGTLPDSLQCGEMDVPMDWSKPFDAASNNITIGFAMNRPTVSSGLILYHAGGPGEDAVPQAWANALNLTHGGTFAGLEDFDFLAVNSRGLQFSTPLNCTAGDIFSNVSFAFPSTEQEFDQYQAAMKAFISSCTENSTPAGIVEHVGTAEVIHDYEAMRVALGYEKISFAGISYGTFVGAAYVDRFPERVANFVLDAVMPHSMPYQDMIPDQVLASNRLLLRADAFCLTDPTCPFYGQGKGSVVAAWDTLLARAIEAPLPAPGCGPGGNQFCNDPVTATDLRMGFTVFMRSNSDFPAFNQALNASLNGDATGFAYVPIFDIRETVVVPLLCSDFSIGNLSGFEAFNDLSVQSRSVDTHKMIYSQMWQLIFMCATWPFAVPEQKKIDTKLPILWMTSDFDLNLPTELTTFAHAQTPNATLMVRHGDNHCSIDVAPPANAAQGIMADFIRTGMMPGPRDDGLITIVPPGGTRAPVPDAYDVPTGAIAGDISGIQVIT
ncbi:hypothetical protein C8J57DRAFT_1274354 [Mycena rebaudengoi]|nr:hypothetical protein C8J57DRAFT_1274354 [Mycena rebaudengoi]